MGSDGSSNRSSTRRQRRALVSNGHIGMAMGILMERHMLIRGQADDTADPVRSVPRTPAATSRPARGT